LIRLATIKQLIKDEILPFDYVDDPDYHYISEHLGALMYWRKSLLELLGSARGEVLLGPHGR
jgi:hypothetical protein